MRKVTFDILIELYQKNLVSKTDLLRQIKVIGGLTDEQALRLFDLGIWGQGEIKAWFQL